MKTCPNCKIDLLKEDIYCPNCGTKYIVIEEVKDEKVIQKVEPKKEVTPNKTTNNKIQLKVNKKMLPGIITMAVGTLLCMIGTMSFPPTFALIYIGMAVLIFPTIYCIYKSKKMEDPQEKKFSFIIGILSGVVFLMFLIMIIFFLAL